MSFSNLVRCSWMLIFLIVKVSCFHEPAAPFPISNGSSITTTLGHGVRDPCVELNFQPPVYHFTEVALRKETVYWDDWGKRWFLRNRLSFTLTDVSNGNRTSRCVWPTSGTEWDIGCQSLNANESADVHTRHFMLVNLPDATTIPDNSRLTNGEFGLVEYWFCPIRNGSFPEVYQSKAWVHFDATCPFPPKVNYPGQNVECALTPGQFPLKSTAQWQTPGPLPGTPVLQPRPTLPPSGNNHSLLLSTHCTYSSLAYPEWELSRKDRPLDEVSFTVASRASGAKWNCTSTLGNRPVVGEERSYPNCVTADRNNPAMIRSKLEIFFFGTLASNETFDRLSITEDWTCGDPESMYSTNFTARGNGDMSSLGLNEPIVIKGSLVRPISFTPNTTSSIPPNINTPGCSVMPSGGYASSMSWSLLHFLYEAERRYTGFGRENGDISDPDVQRLLAPYSHKLEITLGNTANNYTISCALNFTALDGPISDRWFACPPVSAGGRDSVHSYLQYAIQTYVQFDRDTRVLRVNQTWYCNETGTPYQITALGQTPNAPYKFPDSNLHNRILCGNATNIVRDMVCNYNWFVGFETLCDLFVSKRWCSLDGTRDGSIAWLPPAGDIWPEYLFVPWIQASSIDRHQLPANAFTPYSVPEANSSAANSCTVLSLGGRGPVTWTIRPTEEIKYFTSTFFPPDPGYGIPQWKHTEGFPTRLVFDLASSVFPASSYSSSPDRSRGSGVIHNLGTVSFDPHGGPGSSGRWFSGSNLTLTPYMKDWDPTAVYRSVVNLADRFGSERTLQIEGGGWDFYNALHWDLRFDLSMGYMELNHSWYCDDLNAKNPIIFNGTWNGYIPLKCSYDQDTPYFRKNQTMVACYLAGSAENRSVDVTPSVTYEAVNYTIPDLQYDSDVCRDKSSNARCFGYPESEMRCC